MVVDLVPFFTEANPYAAGIVPVVNELTTATRAAGGRVDWVVPAPTTAGTARREFLGEQAADAYGNSGGDGPLSQRLDPRLDAGDADHFHEKSAASAFFPGACELHRDLQAAGVTTLLVTGTVANVCVEATIRDASHLGYRVIAVADAIAAIDDGRLNASLDTIYRSFGDVRPATEVSELLDR